MLKNLFKNGDSGRDCQISSDFSLLSLYFKTFIIGIVLSLFLFWISYWAQKNIAIPFPITPEMTVSFFGLTVFAIYRLFAIFWGISKAAKKTAISFLIASVFLMGTLGLLFSEHSDLYYSNILISALYLVVLLIALKPKSKQSSTERVVFFDGETSLIEHEELQDCLVEHLNQNMRINIGVSGTWGSGKTHLLMNVYKKFQASPTPHILVWIDLWGLKSSDNIVKAYFNAIEKSLTNHQVVLLAQDLKSIAQNLLESPTGSTIDTIKTVLFSKRNDNVKNRIAEQLKFLRGKKVLIFLDNIERLAPSEMAIAFRLVNLFDEFEQIQHVIAYDRSQLHASLSSEMVIGDSRRFLEKIVDFEVTIPPLENRFTVKQFSILFNLLLAQHPDQERQRFKKHLSDHDISKLTKLLKTPRELKRFLIDYRYSFSTWALNLNAKDLFLILLLKIKFPVEYERFCEHIESFILHSTEHRELNLIQNYIWEIISSEKNQPEIRFIISQLIPATEEQYDVEAEILLQRRLWHTSSYHRYLRFDETSPLLSPDQIDKLIRQIQHTSAKLTIQNLTDIENTWTLFIKAVSETNLLSRAKISQSLIIQYLETCQNNQSEERYFSIAGILQGILDLSNFEQRLELLEMIIQHTRDMFYIPYFLIKNNFSKNSAAQISMSKTLTAHVSECLKIPGCLEKLDYRNLSTAFFLLKGTTEANIFRFSIEYGGDFVFRFLEIAATKQIRGDTVQFHFSDKLHPIFTIIDAKQLCDIAYRKRHMANGVQQLISQAFFIFYQKEIEKLEN